MGNFRKRVGRTKRGREKEQQRYEEADRVGPSLSLGLFLFLSSEVHGGEIAEEKGETEMQAR